MEEAPPASPGSEQSPRSGGGGGGSHDGGEHYPHSPGGGVGDVPGGHGGGGGSNAGREQDRFLPVANVTRIMKKGLPNNAKIAKDSKEAMQECVSEFISFVTSEASHRCLNEKRKTINGDDLLWAMAHLGFDKYIKPLKLYLKKYRETEGGEGSAKREVGGAQPGTNATGEYQVPQQGSLPQNINYVTGPQYPYGGF